MVPRVIEARYVRDYVMHVRFADGMEGDIDLRDELEGEIFHPVREPAFFKQFTVSEDLHTVVWPNGADLAPEFLYRKLRVPA